MIRFRHLRTRLTVLYAGLFGIALLFVALAVFTAITASARSVVRGELTATGAVYDQLWESRSAQLEQGAAVLAQDFGFREAVATNDEPTVSSALENLSARQGVDGALLLGSDGYAITAGPSLDEATLNTLWTGLNDGELSSGVLDLNGQPHQAVAAPVMAPVLIGWVVFIDRLDQTQMTRLEELSAIPLNASVLTRAADGWRGMSGPESALAGLMDRAVAEDGAAVGGRTAQGEAMVLARPLPSFDADAPAVLALSYPMAEALKPYEPMFWALGGISLVGLALLVAGTWFLSRGLTRPITALDEAVHRLQAGEDAQVEITSTDEIGRLAESFNAMAGDIRDRQARLTHMALHDMETGLPNRLWLERQAASSASAHVVLFGVDRFEVVRNAIGFEAMGQLVAALGARLSTATGAPVARVGAGVMGLMLEIEGDDADAIAAAARLCAVANEPLKLIGARIDASLTAGLARAVQPTGGLDAVVDRAGVAIDQARAAGSKAALFDAAAYGDPGANLSLMSDLICALESDHVWMAYQPKFDLRQNAITGVEGLMRWNHPKRDFIAPDLFIGMAEETGQIRALTEWGVRRAIADQKALAKAGHRLKVSINVSGRLLSDESFARFALNAVSRAKADLCFEITETAVIDNPEAALGIIDRFAAAGIKVSIDDYGSGLSSLAYLKRIAADELKIDKAFVMSLDESAKDALLVKSTIDLAHSLGMTVTAEGVETQTAMALLRGMGCDTAQGYLIARPLALTALIERLEKPALEAAA
ncbi:putative bifunctional diguanylate cyclase/phosphodiesterase [Brevundimonas bacteroides]|uniref:putative bifunctional diguanylate cyclase/phosphodiesterase n=1 Tax=Brevundimonas bacteroides TaxID=74311 RepID=UPI00068C0428|nr:EAL domain-containing protein [Brevundimonas bacteroides]